MNTSRSVLEAVYHHFYQQRHRRWTRAEAREQIAGCKVVSVGNITTGGTGKTPTVQWVTRLLQRDGRRVAVVARGYRGQLSTAGAVVSDGRRVLLDARAAGDEPVLHARALPGVPVLIGRDRAAMARQAVQQFGVEIVVLDDAFQYWSLHRDFDLVLLDARRPFDNKRLLPCGRLREPIAEIARADAILLTRCDLATPQQLAVTHAEVRHYSHAPLFQSVHAPVALRDASGVNANGANANGADANGADANGAQLPLEVLSGQPVMVLSALADNAAFAATLQACGAQIASSIARRDHHHWTPLEIRRSVAAARASGAQAIVTTEKDAVKIAPSWLNGFPLWSLVIELQVTARADELAQLIRDAVI